MSVLAAPTTWNKPPRERHAHVGDLLRRHLEGVSKAAQDLALYLFEYFIDGRYDWINLYDVPLGEERVTEKRSGKRYARNTMREALKALTARGLVLVEKRLFGGMFYLTVSHPGEKRPFERSVKNSTTSSRIRPTHQSFDQIAPETLIPSSSITEKIRTTAEQAAAGKSDSFLPEKEDTPKNDTASPTDLKPRMLGSDSGKVLPVETQKESTEPTPARFSRSLVTEEEKVSPEKEELITRVRDQVGMTPQLRKAVLSFTFDEIEGALTVLREREKTTPIKNPKGFLLEALRGKWGVGEKEGKKATIKSGGERYPAELLAWYAWASEEGIVDGRPLKHCSSGSTSSTNIEWLQVAVMRPKEERHPRDIVPYNFVLWREAMKRYPMPSVEPEKTEEPVEESDGTSSMHAPPPPQNGA